MGMRKRPRGLAGAALVWIGLGLEEQLGRDLKLTRAVESVVGSRDSAEGCEACAAEGGDATREGRPGRHSCGRGAGGAGCGRRCEGGVASVYAGDDLVVEQVEGIGAELKLDALPDGNIAGDTEVDVVESRSNLAVTTDLRGTAGGGCTRAGAHGAAVDVAFRATTDRTGHAGEDGLAGGGDHGSGEEEVIQEVLHDLVVLEDLRLIDDRAGEAVADVDVGETILQPDVVGIERGIATVEGAVGALDLAGVAGVCPGVVEEQFQPVVEGPPEGGCHRVVPGVGDAEAGVVGRQQRVVAVRGRRTAPRDGGRASPRVERHGKLLDEVVVGVEDVVAADAVRGLADEVRIEEDRETHSASADVADGE